MRHKKYMLGIIIITLIILLVFVGVVKYVGSRVLFVEQIAMDVIVLENGRKLGFNVDTDAVHFGSIVRGGTGKREIIVTNELSDDVRVKLSSLEELGSWVSFEKNDFILEAGTNMSVMSYVQVPIRANLRQHNGTVSIVYKKI